MDSLTQIVLGASLAAVVVPAADRRRALLVGAVLGTLPDLDVIPLALLDVDPVTHMTWHRGPSHSLFVLAVLAVAIGLALGKVWRPVREAPRAWLLAIMLALLTHPLLDALTVYGTQLAWPLPVAPVMWSSLFIIDPLYTLPMLAGCIAAIRLGARASARSWLVAGLALSTVYLGWSLLAKTLVEQAARRTLTAQGLADAPRFSVPMPFNTLLWRVVVMTDEGFLEGERSLVADRGPIRFTQHASDRRALAAVAAYPAVQRLDWFTHGFLKATRDGDRLILSDLRMGIEPDYTFRFVVAERDGEGWREVVPGQLAWPWQAGARFGDLWQRIFVEPDAP